MIFDFKLNLTCVKKKKLQFLKVTFYNKMKFI